MLNKRIKPLFFSQILLLICLQISCSDSIPSSTYNGNPIPISEDIIWLGEVTADYILNEKALDEKYRTYILEHKGEILKQSSGRERENKETLAKLLLDSCGSIDLYKDILLKQEKKGCDTTETIYVEDIHVTFDPETFEEIIMVVNKELNSTEINAFRFKQQIYYEKNSMSFRSIPLAVAPLDFVVDEATKKIVGLQPLFWVKPNDVSNINWDSIEWGGTMDMSFSVKGIDIIKEKKSFDEVIKMMMKDIKSTADRSYIATQYSNNLMSPKEIKSLGVAPNLIFKFNEETYEEMIYSSNTPVNGNSITKIAIRQEWAFEKGKLNIKYIGFTPIIEWKDNKGNVLIEDELFYRNSNRDLEPHQVGY